MPLDSVGFNLRPEGLFDRSPVLDVPPSEPVGDHCHVAAEGHSHGAAGEHC